MYKIGTRDRMAQKTRRNKKEKQQGGRRKTRKGSEWTRKVTDLYHKMKKQDKSVSFMQALKKASQLKKQGKL